MKRFLSRETEGSGLVCFGGESEAETLTSR